jgi:hypothetical protein
MTLALVANVFLPPQALTARSLAAETTKKNKSERFRLPGRFEDFRISRGQSRAARRSWLRPLRKKSRAGPPFRAENSMMLCG